MNAASERMLAPIDDMRKARTPASTPPSSERPGENGPSRVAGITVTSVKGIFYEWVRDLATYHRLQPQLNAALPEGLTL